MIHPLSDCQAPIPDSTSVWQFCVILPQAKIGKDCNICSHCFIENDVTIGDRVTIKSGVQIWDGVRIEDDVFIGPNVSFTNDRYPRSKQYPEAFEQTTLRKGASIGAGSTLVCGIEIGEKAMVGAGSVVTKSIPAGELWAGNPARYIRKIEE